MIQRNFEQERIDAQHESELIESMQVRRQAHELAMAELKLKNKPTIDGRTKIWTTLIKAPVYPLVVICIALLVGCEKPVPAVLEEFLRS